MAEHSPTPWQSNGPYLYGSGEVRYVRIGRAMPEPDIIGRTICEIGLWLDMPEEQEANGTFIVRAANCHEDLVRELEDCELSLKLDVDEWGSPRLKGTLANIRAALATAKESRLQQQDLDEETL